MKRSVFSAFDPISRALACEWVRFIAGFLLMR